MKKLILLLLTLILVIGVTACKTEDKGNNEKIANLEDNLEDILDKIYETANVSDAFKEYMEPGLQTTVIPVDNTAYFLGKEDMEFESAIASEPLRTSTAYSLCLVRVKEGADIEKIKTEIKENANPQKWICVGIDPKNIIVDSIGDVIILIMSDDEGTALHNAFLALKE